MKPSVLIVDDEKVICDGLARLLGYDYTTYQALNGMEAIHIIQRNREIDVMLCDIKMPGMDGDELIEQIRADNRDIFIVVITAASPVRVCDAMRKGADNYIRKPFDINHLEIMLRNAVNRISSHDEKQLIAEFKLTG
jgi:CheY-like chemotaxis protein